MKLITLDPYNSEHKNIIDKSLKKDIFKNYMKISSILSKEEYEENKNNTNEISEYLLKVENDEIRNYCFFSGTKDNRLVQIVLENLLDKSFLEESTNYAFQVLNAHTITIFSDKDDQGLEKIGFESLGKENGITTYIKEKDMTMQIEKVR